jgi:hypothetical protein
MTVLTCQRPLLRPWPWLHTYPLRHRLARPQLQLQGPATPYGDSCDPATMAVIVYDMQAGVLGQLPDGGAAAAFLAAAAWIRDSRARNLHRSS